MKNYSNRLSCIYVRICNKFGDKQSLASSDMGNFLRKCEKLPSFFYFPRTDEDVLISVPLFCCRPLLKTTWFWIF